MPDTRLAMLEDILDLSEAQITKQPQRAQLRFRLQPSKLLLAPNTKRFRRD